MLAGRYFSLSLVTPGKRKHPYFHLAESHTSDAKSLHMNTAYVSTTEGTTRTKADTGGGLLTLGCSSHLSYEWREQKELLEQDSLQAKIDV